MAYSVQLNHEKLLQEMEENKATEKNKKHTQEELAEELGITDRHIRNLKKNDRDVSASLLYNISQKFGKSMEYFLIVGNEPSEE